MITGLRAGVAECDYALLFSGCFVEMMHVPGVPDRARLVRDLARNSGYQREAMRRVSPGLAVRGVGLAGLG